MKTITEQLSRELHLPAQPTLPFPQASQGGGEDQPADLQAGPATEDPGEQQ